MRPHSQYRQAVRADLLRVCHVIPFATIPVPASVPVWITAHHRATCPEGLRYRPAPSTAPSTRAAVKPFLGCASRHFIPKFKILPGLTQPTGHCLLTPWFLPQLQTLVSVPGPTSRRELPRFISQNSEPCSNSNFLAVSLRPPTSQLPHNDSGKGTANDGITTASQRGLRSSVRDTG